MEQERELAAAQHDADMLRCSRCGKCGHVGLEYDSERIAGRLYVWAVCSECGARREI